ncbi:phage tail protein [Shimia sp. SK013]|uniref:phage tail protein n=1 Tax=Shimia sp. SK013 TaxID=1389006 RepID=UPI0006B50094|nr:tail fiber protein [Shimia sp. SK013]
MALTLTTAATFWTAPTTQASAQEVYLGTLHLTAGTYCPRGWTEANGQLLPISQNTALFSVIGTSFGGDGRTTFALPDLRGRAPIHYGTGPGLSGYSFSQVGGAESFTLTQNELPPHSHLVNATNAAADRHGPGTDLLATSTYQDGTNLNIYSDGVANKTMNPSMIASTGNGQPKAHRGPFLSMRYCVATEGLYPPRN